VTLDGAPQNDPFGGWVIWSALPPEGLEGATVVRGAGAGPYGAGALTGVVTLQERGAAEGVEALDVSAGERSTYRAAAAVGGPGVLVTAAGETTDGYVPVRGPAAGAADTPTDLHDWTFATRVQHEVLGAEGAARLSVYEERRNAGLEGARSIASGASAAFTLAQPAAEGVGGWRLQAWARASDLKNSSAAVAAGRTGTTPANDQYATPAQGYGLNAALQGKRGALSWEVGGDVRYTTGREAERFRFMSGGFTRRREAGGKTLVGGVYAEGAWDAEPWLVTGGVRLDGWRSTDAFRREFDTTAGAPTLISSSPDKSGTTPTARFGARYSLNDVLWLRGAAYAGFRPPTLNELHRPFRVGNDITEANPLLKPETLQGIEAGLGGQGAVRWSATAFYNRLKDPITNVTIGEGPGVFPIAGFVPAGGTLRQRQNAGEIEAYGVEAEANGTLVAALAWRAAFSWTHARVDGGDTVAQLTGNRPAQTPEWTVTAGLDWRPEGPFSLSADARYESDRFEDDLNSRVLEAGTQVDLRAGWRVSEAAEVYVAAENLLDEELAVAVTGDGVESFSSPRTLRMGFSYRH
jgi:outer membrane receptor protein involved in Fe transport